YVHSGGRIDRAASDASRMFYTPTKPSSKAEYLIDTDAVAMPFLDWRRLKLRILQTPKVMASANSAQDSADAKQTKQTPDVLLTANGNVPHRKLQALIKNSEEFCHSWEYDRPDFGNDLSDHLYSLISFMRAARWSKEEEAYPTIVYWHSLRPETRRTTK